MIEARPAATAPDSVAAVRPVTFSRWRDTVARSLLSFDFDFAEPHTFEGYVRNKPFAELELIDMACDRHAAHRDVSKISQDERADYLVTLQLSGEFRLTQDGRTAILQPGQFAFYDSTKPAEVVSSNDYHSLCLKFPQKLLGTPNETLHELTATSIDANAGLAPSVWALLRTLNDTIDSVANANRYSTVSSVMSLVNSMIMSQAGAHLPTRQPETRESLLHQIHEYINEHLGEPELGPQQIAAAHFISVRNLHSLFQDTGVTVSAWIRNRRVEYCRNDLSDPLLAHVPAAAIARRRGFKGASHFGQIFKSATGMTPADFRHMALNESR
jgi:AraC-like DNA-binding protein